MQKKRNKKSAISLSETQRLLGSDEPVDIGKFPSDPIAMRLLPAIVSVRLVSTGGRPTDPEWTITRKIPMRPATWTRLEILSHEIRLRGASIAPGQIAAIALETGIAAIRDTRQAIPSGHNFSRENREEGERLCEIIEHEGLW